MPILLGRLAGIDESLFVGSEIEPQLFNSFIEWYQNRTSLWGKNKIDQILVSEFGIQLLSVKADTSGFFGKYGFYASSQKKWFSEAINERVLEGKFGLIESRPDFSSDKNTKLFSSVTLHHYVKCLPGKPVRSVFVSDGRLLVKTNQNVCHLTGIRKTQAPILEGANADINASVPVWDISDVNETVNTAGSGGLVVFSGTDSAGIEKSPEFIANKECAKGVVVIQANELTSEKAISVRKTLRGREAVVVFLSKAKNFVDLYEELKLTFSIEDIILYLAHYEIRVSVDKLCEHCKEETNNKAGVSRLAVGFNLAAGCYAKAGGGCNHCVGGYEGAVVLVEKMKGGESTSEAIIGYEKERRKEFVPPSVLVEKNKDVRNVYKELNTFIAHKEVSIEDGIKAVL